MNRLYESFCVCLLLSMMLWQSGAAQPQTALESGKSITQNTILASGFYQYGLVLYGDGSAIPGVTISDNFGDSAVTDSNGAFVIYISSTPATITPSLTGLIFVPASVSVDGTMGDIIFTGYPASTNTIGGTINDSVGTPLTNAEVRNSAGHTTYTDNTGYYQFSEPDGSYTITPTEAGYAFSPAYLSVSVPPDFTTADFTGTKVSTYTISGHINDSDNNPVAGVTVNLGAVIGGGNLKAITTTDTTGAYTFATLVPATYTIMPALANHTFSPASLDITVPRGSFKASAISLYENSSTSAMTTISRKARGTLSRAARISSSLISCGTGGSAAMPSCSVNVSSSEDFSSRLRRWWRRWKRILKSHALQFVPG